MRDLIARQLGEAGFEVHAHASANGAIATLRQRSASPEVAADVVVTALALGGEVDGIGLCRHVRSHYPDIPLVILTAYGSFDSAVEAIRVGAFDYLTKPYELPQLLFAIDRAVRTHRLESELGRLRTQAELTKTGTAEILGDSDAIEEARRVISRMAASDAPVLVRGESGTGKALAARSLHLSSARRDRPFVVANVATAPANRLERELFGDTTKEGLLLQAGDGTIVLDKVGDIPPEVQPKLVRVLEEGLVRPVGSNRKHHLLARIIATTNRDLERAIEDGDFRADLYHCLGVLEITLPPLRMRGHDVLMLAQAFLDAAVARNDSGARRLSTEVAERLLTYPWPGNVRELYNCMERCAVLARYAEVTVAELPPRVREFKADSVVLAHGGTHVPLAVVERQYILRVLDSVGGNKALAARVLGVGRKTLYRKLEKYGLGSDGDGSSA